MTAEELWFQRGREEMVTASTCNDAGGAVSHPLALIPTFLPGRGPLGPPCRFLFRFELLKNCLYYKSLASPVCCQQSAADGLLPGLWPDCRHAASLPYASVDEAIHANVHNHTERQEREQY